MATLATTDLRVALRSLLRRPLLAGLAVATLALGIGANASIFSFADAVAFRPLPVKEPERLVALFATRTDGPVMGFSFPDYLDLRGAIPGIAGMAAFFEQPVSIGRANEDPLPAWSMLVSESYFPMLGIAADRGRLFAPDEAGRDGRGGAAVAVLSHRCFVRRFGADSAVVGATVRISGHPFTVVGVAPEGFSGTRLFSYAPDVWLPISQERTLTGSTRQLELRGWGSLHLLARLLPGATPQAVEAAAAAAAGRLAAAHRADTSRTGVMLVSNRTPVNPWMSSPAQLRAMALLGLAGVAVVLLVACVNVANLQLVRVSARRRELAVRVSLGASRWAIARQLLLESVLLALGGGAAGLLLGWWGTRLLTVLLPRFDYELAFHPRLDWRVALFAMALALLSALLFGLLPAWRAGEPDPVRELKGEGGRDADGGGSRLRHGLLVTQVAFSMVVLLSAGLFLRSLAAAQRLDLGFDPEGALVFGVDSSVASGGQQINTSALQQRIAERLRALPGVRAVTWADDLPLDGNSSSLPVAVEGRQMLTEERVTAPYQIVETSYFTVMGIPLRSGRTFRAADRDREIEATVVSATLARRLWGDEDAVGRRLVIPGSPSQTLEVVGVASDSKMGWLGEQPQPTIFFDLQRSPTSRALFVVRYEGAAAAIVAAARGQVRRIDPRLPLTDVGSLRDHFASAFAPARNGAFMSTGFALMALLLAASGIYGVIAYGVAQRLRELAIRLAVGATPRALVGAVLGRTLRLLGAGVALGLAGGAAVGILLRGLLYGISPGDPLALGAAVGVVLGVGVLATLAPAGRVLRVDPARILRGDA